MFTCLNPWMLSLFTTLHTAKVLVFMFLSCFYFVYIVNPSLYLSDVFFVKTLCILLRVILVLLFLFVVVVFFFDITLFIFVCMVVSKNLCVLCVSTLKWVFFDDDMCQKCGWEIFLLDKKYYEEFLKKLNFFNCKVSFWALKMFNRFSAATSVCDTFSV